MTPFDKTFAATLSLICTTLIASPLPSHAQSNQRTSPQAAAAARAAQAPAVAGVTSARQFSGARPTAAGASLSGIQRALAAYSADMGRMPTAAEGLGALVNPPPGARNWRGPYISSNNFRAALTDPWGNLYRYVVQGTGRQAMHSISSNGPDGQPGTSDDLSVQF